MFLTIPYIFVHSYKHTHDNPVEAMFYSFNYNEKLKKQYNNWNNPFCFALSNQSHSNEQ